jgi:N-acetyl-gamma-glutamyl-phosphate reductase
MTKTRIGIIGASGYSGQELIRLLLRHPRVEIACFTSRQYAGQAVAEVFPKFRGLTGATFVAPSVEASLEAGVAAVFLALPHGVGAQLVPGLLAGGVKVLDLSADFRLKSAATHREFYGHEHPAPELLARAVYGLPELRREQIRGATLVACPGCYPTSIILAAAPALRGGLVKPTGIIATSLSGVSGAGRKLSEEYLFVECNESARAYGLPHHRHLGEIEQELAVLAGEASLRISFAPHLAPLNRGIVSTVHMELRQAGTDQAAAQAVYEKFYESEPFVRVGRSLPDTKHVELTNYCDIAVRTDARTARLIAVSAEDNLTKGAAGQAVQCLNLMCGFEETTGLL